jgi:hypothetical protein
MREQCFAAKEWRLLTTNVSEYFFIYYAQRALLKSPLTYIWNSCLSVVSEVRMFAG